MDTYLLSREQKSEIIRSRRKKAVQKPSEPTLKAPDSGKQSPITRSPRLTDSESNDSVFKLGPFSKLKFGKRNATLPKNMGSTEPKRKKIDFEQHSITLDSGEEVKISPMALAMGLDPRKSEAQLQKLKQALKRPDEQEMPKGTEEKEEDKPVAKTNRRREAKHLPLEVDGLSGRPPGVPLGVTLPPPRKLSLQKPVVKRPQPAEITQHLNLTLRKSNTAPGPIISKAESDRLFRRPMSPDLDGSDSSQEPGSNATTPRDLDSSSDSIGIPSPRIDPPLRKVQFDPIAPAPMASSNSAFDSPVKPIVPTLNLTGSSVGHGKDPETPRTRRRLSRPPTELTVSPNIVELKQEEYKRNSLPLDDKSKSDNPTLSVTKNFVELSSAQAADPVVLDPRGTIRVGRSDSPVPMKSGFMHSASADDHASNSDIKDMISQMSHMLSKYENTLSNHEDGVDRRIQMEIKRREEAERKLSEKLEEIHIYKLEKEIREAGEKKHPEKPSLEALLEKEVTKRQDLERELQAKLEENDRLVASLTALKKKHIALRESTQQLHNSEAPVSESKEATVKQKSDKKTATIKLAMESMKKLEADIRTSEELRLKTEEEKNKAVREKEETQTIVKIVEANLKLKSFAIETIRQKLSQLLLDLSNNPKKMKGEKLRSEIISLQEEFVKLRTEFEVQMKWIGQSVSAEVQQKPLDLAMIPQSYRHLISNPQQVTTIPTKPSRTALTTSSTSPRIKEEDQSLLTLKSLQDTLNEALQDDDIDIDDLE